MTFRFMTDAERDALVQRRGFKSWAEWKEHCAAMGRAMEGGSPADYPTQEAALQHVEEGFESTSQRLGSMKSLIFEPKGR